MSYNYIFEHNASFQNTDVSRKKSDSVIFGHKDIG